jgi:signal transduction histidine kinase
MNTLKNALTTVQAFADLTDSELDWLVDRGEYLEYENGQVIVQQGDPANKMVVLLSGGISFRIAGALDTFETAAGAITGLLPFSRMSNYSGTGTAKGQTRTLSISKELFMPMLTAIPDLGPRLVGLLTDRVRNFRPQELRQEKLASLGKMSAGLAHELNNPSSAAQRASSGLLEAFNDLERSTAHIGHKLGADGMNLLLDHLQTLKPRPLSTLERSDLEDELASWLEGHQATDAWAKAATWADAGLSIAWLEALSKLKHEAAQPDILPLVWNWLEASIRTRSQLGIIQDATARIAGLVQTIKSYTYLDRLPKQSLDIHQGLDNTLALFGHKLKTIQLARHYGSLPQIEAYGPELNQVWTNLVDNALDAMGEKGTLHIGTSLEGPNILVEVTDTGPGIPPEVQSRIFDPFFTTKPQGQGTGMGLDMVRQIIQRHQGSIRVESRPGKTSFQVRLPLG